MEVGGFKFEVLNFPRIQEYFDFYPWIFGYLVFDTWSNLDIKGYTAIQLTFYKSGVLVFAIDPFREKKGTWLWCKKYTLFVSGQWGDTFMKHSWKTEKVIVWKYVNKFYKSRHNLLSN